MAEKITGPARELAAPSATGGARGAGLSPGRLLRSLNDSFAYGKPWAITALAILSALVAGAVLLTVTTPSTLQAWGSFFSDPAAAISATWFLVGDVYRDIFTGSIVDPPALLRAITTGQGWSAVLAPFSETVAQATPLIIAGLAVAIGFRSGVFNIGAQGQIIAGAIAASYVGWAIQLPMPIHLALTVAAGLAGGAVAGFIPGILKAKTGAHEVIVTIMLNYVVLNFLLYLLTNRPFRQPGQSNAISRSVDASAQLPHLLGSALPANLGIVLALLAAYLVSWFMRRSTLGFSFLVMGSNPDAGRTAGIDSKRVTVLVMVISGALAGLAGMVILSGGTLMLTSGFGGNVGFDAITVALLGRNRPLGVVLAALLFGALDVGGRAMEAATGVPVDLISVIQATIVLLVAAPALVREIYRLKSTSLRSVELGAGGWGA